MSTSSESAEEIVRLSLEGMEVIARISGIAAKNVAVALYTVMQDKQKTKGKARLSNMIRTEKELKIFSVKKDELKIFCKAAKSYGILYCALVSGKNKNIDDMVDIMVKAEDAPRINRIIERYRLSTFDKASIENTIKRASEDAEQMAQSGYQVYQRNPEDEMYKIENIQTFIEGPDGELYIIFAYGNNNYTSEMDVIQI